MKNIIKISLLSILLVLLISGCSETDSQATVNIVKFGSSQGEDGIDLKVKKLNNSPNGCPNFILNDMDGKPIELNHYKGKPILINFWATWCPPCRREIPSLVKIYNKYKNDGLVVIGITMDNLDDIKKVSLMIENARIPYINVFSKPHFECGFMR